MPEPLPLWWRILDSKITFAVGFGIGLAVLFAWPSIHWGSSLLQRLPWWGPAIPVALWLGVVCLLWRKNRLRRT